MRILRYPSPARALTLIELLVVIAIINLLLALFGVVAKKARDRARIDRTKVLVNKIELGMAEYEAHWRTYPTANPNDPVDTPEPNPYLMVGVEFDRRWLSDREPGWRDYSKEDLDPLDDRYLVDAWRRRIRYRKVSANRMLIWSVGEDGVDDIGQRKFERGMSATQVYTGDDISNVESDF